MVTFFSRTARVLAVAVLLLAGTLAANCRYEPEDFNAVPTKPINEVLAEHTPAFMAIPGVVGTYEGALDDGTPCIKIMVIEKTTEIESRIPDVLDGYPVVIEETGEIRAMPEDSP